ncbi:MAG: hypothetical protein ACFCBU_15380 [Cyanophyceae cyanobacterium]
MPQPSNLQGGRANNQGGKDDTLIICPGEDIATLVNLSWITTQIVSIIAGALQTQLAKPGANRAGGIS